MITAILVLISIASTAFAFFQRHSNGLVATLYAELVKAHAAAKEDLKQVQALLREEKASLMREQMKCNDLQKQAAAHADAPKMAEPTVASPFDVVSLVDGTETFQMEEDERTVYFEFYKDDNQPKEIRWRLKAKNNKVLADSGEGYKTKQGLKKALTVMMESIMGQKFKSKWKA